ncbi:hypothetical protein [Streptomyces sp. B21-108]|uniref:hypothetical protein n=1 Tax=Streptomyces sp. B21-108 TaxID=3039419 RepID=UPI002FF07188
MPPRAGGDPVPVRREAAVLRITLHRPERRNAHGAKLHDALAAATAGAGSARPPTSPPRISSAPGQAWRAAC